MIIGILSDTHDRAAIAADAIRLLQDQGAAYFIHCGDVGGQTVLDHLAGLRAAFVWGNCDFDRMTLQRYAQVLGIECLGAFGQLELDGKLIAVLHGDDARLKHKILAEQRHDYLLQGHTHIRHDETIGRIRLINPGALHRAAEKTVATLDTATNRLEFHRVAGH